MAQSELFAGPSELPSGLVHQPEFLSREEARWGWQHSIAPTPTLRYSITFRTRRKAP